MSEPSPEAVVASEAAANAVEELHAREEVDQAATEAIITADVAVETSAVAVEQATVANENAAYAADSANEAREVAEVALQQNQALAEATADVIQEQESEIDRKLREMREYIDSKFSLPMEQPNQVEEVEVNGGPGNSDNRTGGDSAEANGGSEEGASQKPNQRYGLRHKRRSS